MVVPLNACKCAGAHCTLAFSYGGVCQCKPLYSKIVSALRVPRVLINRIYGVVYYTKIRIESQEPSLRALRVPR